MEERHIIICRGVPASGKTSFAKNFIEKNQNYIRVNRDDIRKMIHCTKWNTEREALVK
jgi:tRNA uridine 5-carbamoylmethylation protein Kti12